MNPRRSLQAPATAGAPVGCRVSSHKNGERGIFRETDTELATEFASGSGVRATIPPDDRVPVAIGDDESAESGRTVDPPL